MSQLYCITGMHRSNTSAFAKVLSNSGLYFGEDLLGASQHNVYGYFEDKFIIEHEQKLIDKYATGKFRNWYCDDYIKAIDWQFDKKDLIEGKKLLDKLEDNKTYVWKSPRSVLLLDYWVQVIPSLKYLFIVRHPLLVAESLVRRGDMWKFHKFKLLQMRHAINIWHAYNKLIKRYIDLNKGHLILISPQLFNDKEVSQKISDYMDFPTSLTFDSLYDKKLLKSNPDISIFQRLIYSESLELYEDLKAIASSS